jgi:hypothetical protein
MIDGLLFVFPLIVAKDHALREIDHKYRIASNMDDDAVVFEPEEIINHLASGLLKQLPNGLVRMSSKGIGLLDEWQRVSDMEILGYVSPLGLNDRLH